METYMGLQTRRGIENARYVSLVENAHYVSLTLYTLVLPSDITIGFIITRLTYSANSRPVGRLGGSQICSQICSSLQRVSNSIYILHSIYVWLVDLLTLCSD